MKKFAVIPISFEFSRCPGQKAPLFLKGTGGGSEKRPWHWSILALSLFVVMGLVVGCGQKLPDGMPTLYPTEVTITVGGQPAESALVSAFSATSGFTWPIGGKTDASGKVVLVTDGKYAGAPEGELTICVRKTRSEYGPTYDTPKPQDYGEMLAWEKKVESERKEFLVVGTNYNVKETSPLKMTIKKGNNAEKFDIPEDGTPIK